MPSAAKASSCSAGARDWPMLIPIRPTSMRSLMAGPPLLQQMYQLVHFVKSRPDVPQEDLDDFLPPFGERAGRGHVLLEDGREGGAVGDVEDAERADRHVQLD